MTNRIAFQKRFAEGRIVNIGCGDDPCRFGANAVHVDLDLYDYPNFVQADAHHLPFKDQEFDTAVLGDIIEHSPDPVQMFREAARVAKRVVATVFEEWRHEGMTEREKIKASEDELHALGHKDIQSQYSTLPVFQDHCKEIVDDEDIPHHYHINNFKDEDIKRILEEAGLNVLLCIKTPEGEFEGHIFHNWCIFAERR